MVANDMKAIRDALVEARKVIKAFGGYWARETLPIIDAALASTPRNCDVGTALEQERRFDAWVQDRRGDFDCTGKCPAHNGVDFGVVACVLQWAQMP
jgi:hypothetical protein